MEDAARRFRWQSSEDDDDVLARSLGDGILLESGEEQRARLELLDTFERTLVCAGHALVRDGAQLLAVRADDLRSDAIMGVATRSSALFWWDLEPGPLQDVLRRHLGLRAVTPLAAVELRSLEHRVSNEDGKIVARLRKDSLHVDGRKLGCSVTLLPLLGYEREARALATSLSRAPAFRPSDEPLAWLVLRAAGQDRLPLPLRPGLRLQPLQTAQDGVTRISHWLLRAARQHEPGIVADIDTEFVHAYRVALRQLRSLLSLVKGVYPEDDTRRMRAFFAKQARATNRLRDLDVYLLDEGAFRSTLPPVLQGGLDEMFADLRSERAQALRQVRRVLRSATYQKQMAAHEQWLSQHSPPTGPRAEEPIGAVAVAEIRRRARKVLKVGRAVSDSSPAEEVHQLRIECKRLRYLLELFADLFPEGALAPVVRRLKRLQDALGGLNDGAVQERFLGEYLKTASRLDPQTIATVGGLIGLLHRAQGEARQRLRERFSEFDSARVRRVLARRARLGGAA